MGSVSALHDRFVLIVEDEPLVALDLADEVMSSGGRSLVARTAGEALRALATMKFAVAIIDHQLGDEDASPVIQRLEKLQTPFIIYSGYDGAAAWGDARVLRKPAARQHLVQSISDLIR